MKPEKTSIFVNKAAPIIGVKNLKKGLETILY